MIKNILNIFSCDHVDKFIATNLCQYRNTIVFSQNCQLSISLIGNIVRNNKEISIKEVEKDLVDNFTF